MRAIRKGWIKLDTKPAEDAEKPYMLWADDGQASDKTPAGLSYIAPPKPQLPGHEESYHPPAEYLPSEVRSSPVRSAVCMPCLKSCHLHAMAQRQQVQHHSGRPPRGAAAQVHELWSAA